VRRSLVTNAISLHAGIVGANSTTGTRATDSREARREGRNLLCPAGIAVICFGIVFFHALAALVTLAHRAEYGIQDEWLLQDLVLLCCSCAFSLVFCISRGRWASILIALVIACWAIVSYSNGSYIVQDLLLVTSFGCLVGLFLPVRVSRILGGVVVLLAVAVKWPRVFLWLQPPLDLGLSIAIVVFYVILFIALSSVLKELNDHLEQQREMNARLDNAVAQLTSANLGFQQHAFVVEEESAENERKRISRDIHDTVGYVMTNIIMMMEEADSLLGDGPSRVRQLLHATRLQALQGWNEARLALRALRTLPSEEDRGIQAIQRLVKAFRKATGVKVRLELGNTPVRFTEEVEAVLYRLVQEGLTNSFRHGRATAIDISFWMTERDLRITVRDNGVGASEFKAGIGLSGIHERLNPLGGTLLARNIVDGFELVITIPYVDKVH
jgi:signal transduction histidine kinase